MSKSIKVSAHVYDRLLNIMGPQESFSQVIDRCLSTIEILKTVPLDMERTTKYERNKSKEA